MKIIDFNHCTGDKCSHYPDCGWNVLIGGTNEDELKRLKDFVAPLIEQDLTDYSKKLGTEKFLTPTK